MNTDYQISLEPHPRNPRARQRVLTGTDDAAAFRVVVPIRLKTVEEAVEWLRPPNIPADALRQGEFYLLPSHGPHVEAGCTHPKGEPIRRDDCGSDEYTEAGSHYRYRAIGRASFSRTHAATDCKAVVKNGEVAFIGRRAVKTHDFTGRPTYYVSGEVTHFEHGTLALSEHEQGRWYEVVPNKAHGPFPVWGYGPED